MPLQMADMIDLVAAPPYRSAVYYSTPYVTVFTLTPVVYLLRTEVDPSDAGTDASMTPEHAGTGSSTT